MTTTNLFVELLVIGVGAACWVGLLAFAAFGIEFAQADALQAYPVLMALLALVYVFGIISDRIADVVFNRVFSKQLKSKFFKSKRDYQHAKRLMLNRSDRGVELQEYGRTRLRICRGWSLNAILVAVCLNVFLIVRCRDQPWFFEATIWGTCGFLILSVACWWSWWTLCLTEYRQMRDHAEFLDQQKSRPKIRAAA